MYLDFSRHYYVDVKFHTVHRGLMIEFLTRSLILLKKLVRAFLNIFFSTFAKILQNILSNKIAKQNHNENRL